MMSVVQQGSASSARDARMQVASSAPTDEDRLSRLEREIAEAARLLPIQGPITVFVHHNVLHAFEHMPFAEGVRKGGALYGAQPYLPEERYHEYLARGRIVVSDIEWVLDQELGARGSEQVWGRVTRKGLRLAMLTHRLKHGPDAELRWFVAATDALRKFGADTSRESRERFLSRTRRWALEHLDPAAKSEQSSRERNEAALLRALERDLELGPIAGWSDEDWETFTLHALWRVCCDGAHGVKSFAPPPPVALRHRDVLRNVEGVDIDPQVNDLLIRFSATYLDQGFAHWSLPGRETGFFAAFIELYSRPFGPPDAWLRPLAGELRRWREQQISPQQAIIESLDELGVSAAEEGDFLSATFMALRGWAGMIRQIELRSDHVARPITSGGLNEFLAIRLLLERLALQHAAAESCNYRGTLAELRSFLRHGHRVRRGPSVDQRAFALFQLSQSLGRAPDESSAMSKAEWTKLIEEVETFDEIERRRVLHSAFERRFRRQTLDAISLHAADPSPSPAAPRFQMICCIDEREESFRRHLEEIEPQVETFGVAGFFCNAMYYRGADQAHYVPLCPAVIRPSNWVAEKVAAEFEDEHQRRTHARRIIGSTLHQVHQSSRTFAGGAVLTAGLGVLATIPMVARVLFPGWTARVSESARKLVRPPDATQLQLERAAPAPGPEGDAIGFSLTEMADNCERLLRDIGLTKVFSPFVLVIGHGSTSMNNPHTSAYDCGACSGNAGGPNARATAQMLNDDRVRAILAARGLVIPRDTKFVGGFHNTCNDGVTFYDVDFLPAGHQEAFGTIRKIVEEACDRNAHERCRRFTSVPFNISFAAARRYVEVRSEDLAQTRPEYGGATNAICVVGRRSRTRGLFMDRRAFLASYDPTEDNSEGAILGRILGAVIPVCMGISLMYHFSYLDSPGWGCGSKLPHNVTSLLGVMDGFSSDLRTGLSWQAVEIHEPLRIIFVVETKLDIMREVLARNAEADRLLKNEWFQFALLDPDSPEITVFRYGEFRAYELSTRELQVAGSSVEWYRGQRDNLGFPAIRAEKSSGKRA